MITRVTAGIMAAVGNQDISKEALLELMEAKHKAKEMKEQQGVITKYKKEMTIFNKGKKVLVERAAH